MNGLPTQQVTDHPLGASVDRFTFVNAAVGFGLGRVGAPIWARVGALLLWRSIEQGLRDTSSTLVSPLPRNVNVNGLVDAVVIAGSWWAGSELRKRRTKRRGR